MTRIRKGYVSVPTGQLHFRYAGSGAPVVLLHDSPRSSVLHEPLLRALAPRALAIALDTPGYGRSTALVTEAPPTMADFADALADALTALGIERCAIYATHTSSKILLELCLRHPQRVERAVMDGLSLPATLASDAFIDRYMAPFIVRDDGSHFASMWSRARDLHRFFPWFDLSARARLALDLPDPDGMNLYFLDMLRSGPHYVAAYSAAMRHPARRRLDELRTPVAFMCRANDPLYAFLDALPTTLPAGSSVDRLTPDHSEWLAAVERRLLPAATDDATARAELPKLWAANATRGKALEYGYANLPGDMQLHFCRAGDGAGRPIVLLPEQPGSTLTLHALVQELARHRRVFCVDLPGIGASDPCAKQEGSPNAADFAVVLTEFLTSQGVHEVDVYAAFNSSPLALEWARRDSRVRRLVLDGLPVPRNASADFIASYCPPLRAQRDGAQWHALWHRLRDQAIAWPWFDGRASAARRSLVPPPTETLHANVVEVGTQIAHYGEAAAAGLAAAGALALEGLGQRAHLWLDPADVRDVATIDASSQWLNVPHSTRPAVVAEQAQLIQQFTTGDGTTPPPASG